MKNYFLINFVLTTILFKSINVYAGNLSGENVISQIRVGGGVVRVSAGGGSWNDPDDCSANQSGTINQLYLSESNSNFSEIYSAILSARMSETKVQFYVSGCFTLNEKTYPLITTIYL